MSMDVVTTVDKDVRDRLFEDLRKNGNELEKQVVKFSGNEPVIGPNGGQIVKKREYWLDGSIHPKVQSRPVYRSTWSVAYPNS